jgi:hypothetical protein
MEWKAKGYVFRQYLNDHRPWHVHVFKDGRELGRYDLENARFMELRGKRKGAILAAMREVRLIGPKEADDA